MGPVTLHQCRGLEPEVQQNTDGDTLSSLIGDGRPLQLKNLWSVSVCS